MKEKRCKNCGAEITSILGYCNDCGTYNIEFDTTITEHTHLKTGIPTEHKKYLEQKKNKRR